MALCEISTSEGAKLPRECIDWQAKKGEVGGCVESLSRSPQYWSSYSGNLREIVALCSSFRRWADVGELSQHNGGLAKLVAKLSSLSDQLSAKQQQQSTDLQSAQQALHRSADDLSALRDQLQLALAQLVGAHVQSMKVAEDGLRAGLALVVNDHDLTSTVGETDAVARTVVRVMTEVQAAAQLAIASFATSLSSVEEQQAHLSGRLDLNLAQALELAAVLSNLTDQVRQRQHHEREGHSLSWEALEDVLWWIKLFFGFLQEGLGLKGLLISLLVVGFSLLYPSFAYVAGVLTMVLSLYRFLAFVRSLHRPFHHLLFPSKKRTPATMCISLRPLADSADRLTYPSSSSPLAPSSRTPSSPFAPPRSFRFTQPRTTAAVSPSSRTSQAVSAIATASRLARSAAVASGTSSGSAPLLYSGKSLIIGL
ncbi:hypothetical protein JCM5296_002853 [Sporobolomyces johnsonii]